MKMRNARHSAGFTLVELLVALAIFLVIMGSLAALLSGAVGMVRQGYAMMNAMERARGSMSVLEADLKTAFASPEKRQYFQFYGEPNGFMYSGQLVNGGFGRVTYVVHTDNRAMQGTGAPEMVTLTLPWGEVATQFARALCPISPSTGTGVNIDKNDDGVHDIVLIIGGAPYDATPVSAELAAWNAAKPNNGFDQYAARVFAEMSMLLNLGIAPVDFDDPVDFTLRVQRGVLLRYEERGQGTLSEFSNPIMATLFGSIDGQSSQVAPFGSAQDVNSILALFPAPTREKLDRLQQNHYWVRMLSGNLPLNGTVDPFTPQPPPPFWAEDGNTDATAASWRNHVVTEGILTAAELNIPNTDQVVTVYDTARGQAVAVNVLDMASFFFYGTESAQISGTSFNTLWNMASVSLPANPAVSKPLFNYFLFGPSAVPVPQAYAVDPATVLGAFADALRVQVYDYAPGDPMKPRLPAWVAPGFWIFGDPSRTGAAPFHQWFQQKVDIPSAFLRENSGN